MVALPTDGQTGWGDILNTYLTTLETEANLTEANLAKPTLLTFLLNSHMVTEHTHNQLLVR